MGGVDELVGELLGIPTLDPRDPAELTALLARLRSAAARWSDVLGDVCEATRTLAEPGSAAALEIAFRRAEQSYVELEIAHGAALERLPLHKLPSHMGRDGSGRGPVS